MDVLQFSRLLTAANNRADLSDPDLKSLIYKYSYAPALYVLDVLSVSVEETGWPQRLHIAAARTLSRNRLQFLVEGPAELEAEWKELAVPERKESTEVLIQETPVKDLSPETPSETEVQPEVALPNDFGFSFVRIKAGKKPKAAASLDALDDETRSDGKRAGGHLQQDVLIEKFLNEKPFLQPRIDFGEEEKLPDLSRKSSKLKEEVVTEAMAMIYIRQKKFPQAIATLRKLTLKIPEKSDYFAALIKNLESQKPI